MVTRDALREEAKKSAASSTTTQLLSRNVSAPVLAAAPQLSPPTSPTMISHSSTASRSAADPRPIMGRTASIDSTVSVASSTGNHAPQDVASLIAGAGSPEAAIQKLVNEKQQAASHTAQLWRLVEKQRSMILGLNRDLEKSLKEKERYRRKLKENLVQSSSAPVLPSQPDEASTRNSSHSPALPADKSGDAAKATMPGSLRDFSMDSRKVSDASDVASIGPGRSDTPQDGVNVPSGGLLGTPQSSSSANTATEPGVSAKQAPVQPVESKLPAPLVLQQVASSTPPMSPRAVSEAQNLSLQTHTHKKSTSISSAVSPPASATSFSSPKHRKAPPAPLNLSSKPNALVTNNIIDPSDSEYEDDPDSARAEQLLRGRRKTREEDDEEREALAQEELEIRSRSKKDKKSKSRPATDKTEVPAAMPTSMNETFAAAQAVREHGLQTSTFAPTADPAAIVRQRALSDAAGLVKSNTAPSLLSPGLPMSPRPGDRPMNSPMPRAPNKIMNGLPMSPKAGMAGLPMSPRAPKQPLSMVPQTPLTITSPHLARAEIYQHQGHSQQSSLGSTLRPSPHPSPEHERPSMSSVDTKSTGEIYRGLITDQYPDLLIPPNALPNIYVKTSSSRMKPSRYSVIVPKPNEENPVLTLAVHERSEGKQLWRLEKTLHAFALLDQQVKSVCSFRDRLPDKALFLGHSPAKMDARRSAVDAYFERMLDAITVDTAAKVVCKFLSTDAIGAESNDYFGSSVVARSDTPVSKQRPHREGYLTKRGKNFGGWKARYFVLDGPALKYFEAPGGAHLGSIKLQSAQIGKQSYSAAQQQAEDEENQFRHAFLVLEPKKKDSTSLVRHVLCAESDDERDAWVEALLTYVDYKDDDDDSLRPSRGVMPDYSGARSPRLQKSLSDLRPPSRAKDAQSKQDHLRAYNYNDAVAGEAPVIGLGGVHKAATPSPPPDGAFHAPYDSPPTGNPLISGPTNLQVISNAGDWGMGMMKAPPPTPSTKDLQKDKKRSMFAAFRGRSSSDLAPGVASPGLAGFDYQSRDGIRAVFGVPLAEAVEFAHPHDIDTDLPAVVYRCIEYLMSKNAIAEEGIFRLSGSNTVIKSLKDRFNAEGDVNLVASDQYYDIHAVASLLKLYLRELPASILTRDLHLEFLGCLDTHGKEKNVALNVLVHKLPRPNRALLQALSEFLLSIVSNADVNKMNVRNGKWLQYQDLSTVS